MKMCDYADFTMIKTHSLSFMKVLGCCSKDFQPETLFTLEKLLLAVRKYECSIDQSPALSFHPQILYIEDRNGSAIKLVYFRPNPAH